MAHAFDNRNFIPNKQQTCYNIVSSSRPDIPNTDWERISSSKQNRPSSSYEENASNKLLVNHPNSTSTTYDSTYRPRRQSETDNYFTVTSEKCNSNTKPPPLIRVPRLTSTTNNSYIRSTNILPQSSSHGIKTNTTYLNTTQLYINQPSSQDPSPPPPPPPRYPLHPPAVPLRNPSISYQKNSITIPIFNSSILSKPIYHPPVISSIEKRNDQHIPEHRTNSFLIGNNHHIQDTTNGSTIGEYFGECNKCGETITSSDDPCDILGQIYHSSCAVCILCGRSVKNKYFFVKDHLYCEEDFLYTGFYQTHEQCVACGHLITDTILQGLGQSYHLTCFKCSKCSICLDGAPFIRDKNRNLFCIRDYHITYGSRCDKCSNPIFPEDNTNETVRIISMGKNFHVQCYKCEDCSMQLGNEEERRCYPLDDTLLCQECCHRRLTFVNKF